MKTFIDTLLYGGGPLWDNRPAERPSTIAFVSVGFAIHHNVAETDNPTFDSLPDQDEVPGDRRRA